jgi:membrane-associated phospholipid phosphatase
MRFLTDFGDAMVVLPIAAATLAWLARIAGARTAGLWCLALLACGGGTALLKIYFGACAAPLPSIASPSGHTSMSTLVYGSLALIVGAEAPSWQRFATAAMGAAAVIGIALSRVTLGAHSVEEVLLGLAIGGSALALFAPRYLEARSAARNVVPLAAVVVALMLLLHGHSAHLEALWRGIAAWLHNTGGLCRG